MLTNKENQKGINPNCQCPKTSCRRHGDCKACKRHHHNNLVFCKLDYANLEEMNSEVFNSHFHKRQGKAIAYEILINRLNNG